MNSNHDSIVSNNVYPYDQANYKMNHENRGHALVINMHEFKGGRFETRHGSKEDVKSLKEVLGNHLKFDVICCENLTRQQMSLKLDECKNKEV